MNIENFFKMVFTVISGIISINMGINKIEEEELKHQISMIKLQHEYLQKLYELYTMSYLISNQNCVNQQFQQYPEALVEKTEYRNLYM